jgi:4-hydroxy-4-methyl-2-oxoglutarate aldolase
LNYPVSCGGIVVNPGDVIFGDSSGVVVIRKEFAEEISEQIAKHKSL